MKLENKIALVTGGASGLGRTITELLLNSKTKVAVLDKNKKALEDLNDHSNLLKITCDITNEKMVSKAIEKIKSNFSKIDILINNAGLLYNEPLVNMMSVQRRHSLSNWQKIIDVNLTAPFVISTYVAELMVINRVKGIIINISSISAKGNAGQTAYSASKAGLEAMTKVWAKELGIFGIRCISIAPGFMNTNSTHNSVTNEVLNHVKEQTPLKKLGSSENIAQAIKFVIKNDYINAKTLNIDGGLVI